VGRITRLLSFVRALANGAQVSDVKVDPGGGENITAQHFAPAGDDSHPLPNDYAAIMPVQRTGSEVAVGYLDPLNEPKAQPGDKRVYARDAGGAAVVDVWLKNDGTATTANSNGVSELLPDGTHLSSNSNGAFELKPDGSIKGSNSNGSFELQAGGDFLVNGVIIDTEGNITSPATVQAQTISTTTLEATAVTATTVAAGTVTATTVAAETGFSADTIEASSIKADGKELAGHTHVTGTMPTMCRPVSDVPGDTGENK
jgi:hypothetical protein